MQRREFLKLSAAAGLLTLIQAAGIGCSDRGEPVIHLPALPYPPNGLEPYISEETISFHHGRHHRGYVQRALQLVEGSRFADMGLVEIIRASSENPAEADLFNAAAQAWNHQFYWQSLTPAGGGRPALPLLERIRGSFGSYERFADAFVKTGMERFGSGWLWLVEARQGLALRSTANAGTPIAGTERPLLGVDLWEHAYYLDFQDRRGDYLRAVRDHLINWVFAEKNASK